MAKTSYRPEVDAEVRLASHTVAQLLPAVMPQIDNPSGINPTGFKVLVRPDDAQGEILKEFAALQKAGFQMADGAREQAKFSSITGVMIAASPLAFGYDRWPDGARKPQVNDRVLIAKFCGLYHKGKDGVEYRVVEDKDIVATLD